MWEVSIFGVDVSFVTLQGAAGQECSKNTTGSPSCATKRAPLFSPRLHNPASAFELVPRKCEDARAHEVASERLVKL